MLLFYNKNTRLMEYISLFSEKFNKTSIAKVTATVSGGADGDKCCDKVCGKTGKLRCPALPCKKMRRLLKKNKTAARIIKAAV
jgi:hypothetical protein